MFNSSNHEAIFYRGKNSGNYTLCQWVLDEGYLESETLKNLIKLVYQKVNNIGENIIHPVKLSNLNKLEDPFIFNNSIGFSINYQSIDKETLNSIFNDTILELGLDNCSFTYHSARYTSDELSLDNRLTRGQCIYYFDSKFNKNRQYIK